MSKNKKIEFIILAALVAIVAILPLLPFFRIDLTSEKRFSIAPQSRQLMKSLTQPITITFYSGGNIDANFVRLNHAAGELIDELNVFSATRISYKFINPSEAPDET